MKITNYLSIINLFVVLLISFKNVHEISLINTKKYQRNIFCAKRILGDPPSANPSTSLNQNEDNHNSNPDANKGNTNKSDKLNGDNIPNSQSKSENTNLSESPKTGTASNPPQPEPSVQPGNTNGDSQNSIHSDDEEEDDEDEDDDEEDCSVNNGGCGENLLCEKMESGIIKCSCPSGYKLNGTSCIELLSAHSVNYCFCGILIILIILVSMIY
ncbi:hypothetical protein YYC_04922 [Plasmodium yoelii 17X]|uniref:Merozoite surface protein 4/5 n=14 Tax=Plasmodium yoelii TaxID=5861 RepID=A0AAF0B2Q4_PLAYO|nr:uncharacterized protein PY17X_0305000 [Plasmodium yoelii]EAA20031.1 MSP4/5 [Plasmodium yoelii yoelii]ETB57076.1 hypothetical protein YYC_04922 [Plasmodium yoelii 17X]AAF37358.1 merozoite surface protein 4/5 [Plasmodium yoelii]WBY54960.1 merozoite surface protein 4/5 [Plasmodium yoelii yoelii]CDU16237.1 merozoite surface protein 4/5 [Plasmodium yoelii]|eukprot:XP_728466.1 uncharacterized protein PY17X_0305000 [Plasmodium yoelii]